MKKIIIAVVMLVGISSVNAQSFGKGTSVLEVGLGFGGGFGMPISLGYEYGVAEKIGVGLVAAYGSTTVSGFGAGNDIKYTHILAGIKGNYHFYTTDVIDVYAGAVLGYNKVSFDNKNNFPVAEASAVIFGGQLGGRYYFTESLGAFAEVGYGLANFNVGLAYKF